MAIATAISTGKDIFTGTKSIINGIFGGGSDCTGDINRKKSELAQAINTYLTDSQRRELIRGTESSIRPTGSSMAEFFFGGRDCKHKNVTPGDQAFLRELPIVLEDAELSQRQQNAGPIAAGVSSFQAGQLLSKNNLFAFAGITGGLFGLYYFLNRKKK
jgi:hypothetical protein